MQLQGAQEIQADDLLVTKTVNAGRVLAQPCLPAFSPVSW